MGISNGIICQESIYSLIEPNHTDCQKNPLDCHKTVYLQSEVVLSINSGSLLIWSRYIYLQGLLYHVSLTHNAMNKNLSILYELLPFLRNRLEPYTASIHVGDIPGMPGSNGFLFCLSLSSNIYKKNKDGIKKKLHKSTLPAITYQPFHRTSSRR